MAEIILLKKYANRRLYDTAQSAYVTLSEVADLIKAGNQVKVIDAKSEEDVTGLYCHRSSWKTPGKKMRFFLKRCFT
jgi:polyhydroxyalkanoate synthesis regulator protein